MGWCLDSVIPLKPLEVGDDRDTLANGMEGDIASNVRCMIMITRSKSHFFNTGVGNSICCQFAFRIL
jgi:hypothetical protein